MESRREMSVVDEKGEAQKPVGLESVAVAQPGRLDTLLLPARPAPVRTGHNRSPSGSSISSDSSCSTFYSSSSTLDKDHPYASSTSTIAASSSTSDLKDEKSATKDLESQTSESPESQETQKHLGFIRYTLLNAYRRLFSLAFLGNLAGFILLLLKPSTEPLDLVNASAINLAVCGLTRQPLVVNALYLLFGSVPRWFPLRLRRLACKIFHIGGVHSGTGVASLVWYVGFVALSTMRFRVETATTLEMASLALVYLVMSLLLSIVLVAHPSFRRAHHDVFELVHRFANWAILVLFWALLFMLGAQQRVPMGRFLVGLPAFWILLLLTAATAHPWILLRRVSVEPEALSKHAVRLHFDHTQANFGQGVSLATRPLADWHAFASFTDKHDSLKTKFSCLVSRAGDWTGGTIAAQPKKIWVRGVPTYGFGYAMRIFSKLIVVTTGSGVGPCLSFLGDEGRPAMRVVWQARAPRETYGDRTLELVGRLDKDAVIMDTKVTGRVDMLPVVLRLYKEFGAEEFDCVLQLYLVH